MEFGGDTHIFFLINGLTLPTTGCPQSLQSIHFIVRQGYLRKTVKEEERRKRADSMGFLVLNRAYRLEDASNFISTKLHAKIMSGGSTSLSRNSIRPYLKPANWPVWVENLKVAKIPSKLISLKNLKVPLEYEPLKNDNKAVKLFKTKMRLFYGLHKQFKNIEVERTENDVKLLTKLFNFSTQYAPRRRLEPGSSVELNTSGPRIDAMVLVGYLRILANTANQKILLNINGIDCIFSAI